jgi:hypothetical protein
VLERVDDRIVAAVGEVGIFDGINGIFQEGKQRNFDRRNMKADEGEFLDGINKIRMIFFKQVVFSSANPMNPIQKFRLVIPSIPLIPLIPSKFFQVD